MTNIRNDIILDDDKEIRHIDKIAMKYYIKFYNHLFRSKLLFEFMKLFSETLPVIKKKMERDLFERRRIIKENTHALILVVGSTKVTMTEISAQYCLHNMILYSEVIGLGSCLLDSVKIGVNKNSSLKAFLGLKKGFKVLGAMAVGYPEERILNISPGHEVKTSFHSNQIQT